MAIPFRNLQGGNPYQGLANTLESVSSRVGATFMSYAQAKRQRDEERARLKAEKEKSMVDAIVKLVPAAVGYEQQKDAFEYKKEQDKEMLGLRKDSLKLDREKLTNQKEYQRLMAGKEDKRFSLLEQQGKEQDRDRERSYLLQESKIQAEKEQNAKILDIKEKTLAHTQKLKELGAQEALERSKINALKEKNLNEALPWKQKESAIELADKITNSRMQRKKDLYGLYTDIFGTANSVNSLRDPETGEAEMSFSVWATTPTEMGGYGMTLKEFGELSSPYTYLDVYNEMGIELTDQNAVKDDSQMSSLVQELTNEVANLGQDSNEINEFGDDDPTIKQGAFEAFSAKGKEKPSPIVKETVVPLIKTKERNESGELVDVTDTEAGTNIEASMENLMTMTVPQLKELLAKTEGTDKGLIRIAIAEKEKDQSSGTEDYTGGLSIGKVFAEETTVDAEEEPVYEEPKGIKKIKTPIPERGYATATEVFEFAEDNGFEPTYTLSKDEQAMVKKKGINAIPKGKRMQLFFEEWNDYRERYGLMKFPSMNDVDAEIPKFWELNL